MLCTDPRNSQGVLAEAARHLQGSQSEINIETLAFGPSTETLVRMAPAQSAARYEAI